MDIDGWIRRRQGVVDMLNAYFDFHHKAWIACAIIDGQWIEGEAFATWGEADRASEALIAAARSSLPRSASSPSNRGPGSSWRFITGSTPGAA